MTHTLFRPASRFLVTLLIGTLPACGRTGDARVPADMSQAGSTDIHDGRVPAAEMQLSAFLRSSLETSPATETNALMSCVPDGQTDRYLTLARYRVIDSRLRGDTVDVRHK